MGGPPFGGRWRAVGKASKLLWPFGSFQASILGKSRKSKFQQGTKNRTVSFHDNTRFPRVFKLLGCPSILVPFGRTKSCHWEARHKVWKQGIVSLDFIILSHFPQFKFNEQLARDGKGPTWLQLKLHQLSRKNTRILNTKRFQQVQVGADRLRWFHKPKSCKSKTKAETPISKQQAPTIPKPKSFQQAQIGTNVWQVL